MSFSGSALLLRRSAAAAWKNHHHHAHTNHWALPILGRRGGGTLHRLPASIRRHRSFAETALARWRVSVERLYARHCILLAAASLAAAAARRNAMTAQAEALLIEKPSDWVDWERKDWADELLASLGSNKLTRLWSATRRIFSLTALMVPFCVLVPCGWVAPRFHQLSWDYALWSIEQAGPTYIKLFQWATTRQDLFSPEFCRHFGKLRDQTIGHARAATDAILEQDLGQLRQYLELEDQPIGSGCIAQVYKGQLRKATEQYPAGTEIAVKVQHPGIWHKVCVDFYIMGKVAKFLEDLPYLNLHYLSLSDTVRQFRDIMLPQLDLTLEASHLRRFNRDFADDDQVHFPIPLDTLTTTRVLTETFLHGQPILAYTNAAPHIRKELAYLGLSTTLKMIFLHDFLHGDLHAGNIIVSEEKDGKVNLNLLDCGLVVEMGPEQHVNLTKILAAFTRRDGRLGGQLMVDSSSDCQASDWDVEMFVSGIHRIIEEDENNNFVENVGDYITDICYMACRHKVKLEASFINAALAVEIVEGIAQALHPQIIVTKEALPLIIKAEMMHQMRSIW